MCGIRNLRQICSLTGIQLSSNIDFSKISNQKPVKPSSFPNRHCKCLYSTAPDSNSKKQTIDSSDDSGKDKTEENKPAFMKKYGKTIFWSSAVMGTFTLGMLIKRWGKPIFRTKKIAIQQLICF